MSTVRGNAVTLLALAGIAMGAVVSPASAQYELGGGTNLERRLYLGSDYNRPVRNFGGQFRANNAIVTGNAPGGRSFQGDIGYTAPTEFRGNLGTNDLFRFQRDSAFSDITVFDQRPGDRLRGQFGTQVGAFDPGVPNSFNYVARAGSGLGPGGKPVTLPSGQTLRPSMAQISQGESLRFSPYGGDPGNTLRQLRSIPAAPAQLTPSLRQPARGRIELPPAPPAGAQPRLPSRPVPAPGAVGEPDPRQAPQAAVPDLTRRPYESLIQSFYTGRQAPVRRTPTDPRGAAREAAEGLERPPRTPGGPDEPPPSLEDGREGMLPSSAARRLDLQREQLDDLGRTLRSQPLTFSELARQRRERATGGADPGSQLSSNVLSRISAAREAEKPGYRSLIEGGSDDPRKAIPEPGEPDPARPASRGDGERSPLPGASALPELAAAGRDRRTRPELGAPDTIPLDPKTIREPARPAGPDLKPNLASPPTEAPDVGRPADIKRNLPKLGGAREGVPDAVERPKLTLGEAPAPVIDPQLVQTLRSLDLKIDKLSQDEARHDDMFSGLLREGEASLAQGRYFEAERRLTRALEVRKGDTRASVGRVHAQIGAGLYRSAAANLRAVLGEHPELVAAKYDEALLPRRAPDGGVIGELRAGVTSSGEGVAGDAALLLAYIGYQFGEPEVVREGLEALASRLDLTNPSNEALLALLTQVWLPEPASP